MTQHTPAYTVTERDGQDVLPWFQPEHESTLEPGTRMVSFADYHRAPQGTRIRLGRRGGIGQVLIKIGDAWRPEGNDSEPGLTAYGLEKRVSHVEAHPYPHSTGNAVSGNREVVI